MLRRAVREKFDEPDHVLSLATARNSIRDLVEKAVSKPTKKRRTRAARFLGDFQSNSLGEHDRANDQISEAFSVPGDDVSFVSPLHEQIHQSSDQPTAITRLEADPLAPDELDVDSWDVAV